MRIENMNTTMKRFLLGTTAVVGLGLLIPAPVFAAEPITLSIDGTVKVEAFFVSQDDETQFGSNSLLKLDDAGFNLQARGVADNGLRYGAAIKFNTDATGGAISVDERALWFEGGWGRLELGNDDDASSGMTNHGGDLNSGAGGYDGGAGAAFDFNGVAESAPGIDGGTDATKITYFTPRVNGIQVGVSYTPDTSADGTASISDLDANATGIQDQIALGINFVQSFDDVGVRLSYVMVNGDPKTFGTGATNNWAIGAQVDFGNVSVAAGVGNNGDSGETGTIDEKKWADFTVRYADGPLTYTAGYFSSSASTGVAGQSDDSVNFFSIGTAYTVADGLSVYAGFDVIDVDQNGTGAGNDNQGTLLTIGTKMSF
jgi:hypothetical protein